VPCSGLARPSPSGCRSAPQQATLDALGTRGQRELVETLVAAWENGDVDTILGRLAADARFTMPPLAAWFDGRDDIGVFLRDRVFATSWRLTPTRANGQLAFVCRQGEKLSALNILALNEDGRIREITAFLDPAIISLFVSSHPG